MGLSKSDRRAGQRHSKVRRGRSPFMGQTIVLPNHTQHCDYLGWPATKSLSRLILSGSDRYGLPTAKDDDVLLACIQLSKAQGFRSPEVYFSRYELLKFLRWSDETGNDERISQSLWRWKGLSIFSDRTFCDHRQKSWVNRDFGIFDSLTIYRRQRDRGGEPKQMAKKLSEQYLALSIESMF